MALAAQAIITWIPGNTILGKFDFLEQHPTFPSCFGCDNCSVACGEASHGALGSIVLKILLVLDELTVSYDDFLSSLITVTYWFLKTASELG